MISFTCFNDISSIRFIIILNLIERLENWDFQSFECRVELSKAVINLDDLDRGTYKNDYTVHDQISIKNRIFITLNAWKKKKNMSQIFYIFSWLF